MRNENYQVVKDLTQVLANTYVLYNKTQHYHWNVKGKFFFMLHAAFEEQYEALSEAVDVLAERLRALNVYTPGTLKQFLDVTTLEYREGNLTAEDMVRDLLNNHDQISGELFEAIKNAEKEDDQATMDLFIERQTEHQKLAWMLRSCLE